MVKNSKIIGPGPSASKKFPSCQKGRRKAKINCPIPTRPFNESAFDCRRPRICADAIPKKTNRIQINSNQYKKDRSSKHASKARSYLKPYKAKSKKKKRVLCDYSDSDSEDDSTDDGKKCNIPLKPNCIPYRPDPRPCDITSEGENSSDSGLNVEALRRVNENIVKQNEALIDCPYKKAADLNPERAIDKMYYEERIKRMRQLLLEIQEAKAKAEAEVKQLLKDLKKVEETEESAQSMLRAMYTDNRKLKQKIQSIKDELRFQIQANNEEIKRLNDQIINAHKQHGLEEQNKRENIPVLLEKIHTEFENIKNPISKKK